MSIENIKARLEKRQREYDVAVARKEESEKRLLELIEELKKLGVKTPKEAKERIAEIEVEMEQLTNKLNQALEDAGA